MTNRSYYRTALDMLEKAVEAWTHNKLMQTSFLLQLGDVIDGKSKRFSISDKCLASVLEKFSQSMTLYSFCRHHPKMIEM